MNSKEQLWGLPSAPLWPTSTWRILGTRPLIQLSALPRFWKRFVDDTFVVIEASKKQGFLEHINSVDLFI